MGAQSATLAQDAGDVCAGGDAERGRRTRATRVPVATQDVGAADA